MTLNDTDAKAFLDQLNAGKAKSAGPAQPMIESMLGYRGVIVEQAGAHRPGSQNASASPAAILVSAGTTYKLASGTVEKHAARQSHPRARRRRFGRAGCADPHQRPPASSATTSQPAPASSTGPAQAAEVPLRADL